MRIIKTILILCAVIAIGCAQNLKIIWDAPEGADNVGGVEYYIVYKFEGDTTAWQNWTLADMDSIGTLPHTFNYSGPYIFETYFEQNTIIRAGGVAVDSLTRRSQMGLSKFYFPPNIPQTIRVEKP